MGTRHLQTVIDENGRIAVNQYGQWDGYPSEQGKNILNYLKTGDLEKYAKNILKVGEATKEQRDILQKDEDWKINYPYCSRNCGSDIHKLIEDDLVRFVIHMNNEEASGRCEGFYTIDLKSRKFTTEYYNHKVSFDLDSLPTEVEYLKEFEDND